MIIAAELLKNADELVKAKIHPTSVISGYRLACKYVALVVSHIQLMACSEWLHTKFVKRHVAVASEACACNV